LLGAVVTEANASAVRTQLIFAQIDNREPKVQHARERPNSNFFVDTRIGNHEH
jgi:hypothetical protein